ncbi:hypothetical protein D3C84_726930 [compost metagenome]
MVILGGRTASVVAIDDFLQALSEVAASFIHSQHLRDLLLQKATQIGDLDVLVYSLFELFPQLVEVDLAQVPGAALAHDLVSALWFLLMKGFGIIHHHAFIQ